MDRNARAKQWVKWGFTFMCGAALFGAAGEIVGGVLTVLHAGAGQRLSVFPTAVIEPFFGGLCALAWLYVMWVLWPQMRRPLVVPIGDRCAH